MGTVGTQADPLYPPSPYTSSLPPSPEPEGPNFFEKVWRYRGKIALAAAVGGFACFAYYRYHVCPPSQYLVKTGLGIKDMAVARKTLQLPFQEVRTFNMAPLNYTFHLHNMSSEMVPFHCLSAQEKVAMSFTIGPKDPAEDLAAFKTYATKMGDLDPAKVEATIGGVIHGETRVFSAGLTIREMFEDREKFKRTVSDKIQQDMNAYGLKIYNANIAEMADQDEKTRYFQNLRQKALEGANTEMRIQVAEARMQGDIGERERQSRAAQEVAHIKATIVEKQNENAQRVAHSEKELAVVRAECERARLLTEIDVSMATDKRKAELETEVDRARTAQQVAYLQATQVAKTIAAAESAVKEAEGQAEATRRLADAQLYAARAAADGALAAFEAQADGLSRLLAASEQRPDLAKFQL
ncbi:hypothetical protein KFL_003150110 [Klebsormidium nitens]|uniref:Flotillin-like n=1 Tax=Klebsormidium nitens TaxID=105231 RepID=A0A1Y1IDS0_KLENI|nr:hypothetical protein KFL_003150110 [Klebsormidium nitens]|eukprot:GAQ86846.1 hypothetical protein KFL_003150110 [Klebsormidium nitens]